MGRYLPFVIELALVIYCLFDLAQSPDDEVRALPKWAWILLIVLLPLIGSIAWLLAGRPVRAPAGVWHPGGGFPEAERPSPTSDIDARLQADLDRVDREHEEALRRWQQDLEQREGRLREEGPNGTSSG